MIDYYVLLEIDQEAQETEIKDAIRQARRKWSPRQNNPNAETRAEAEQAMRNIAEAERLLLDSEQRAEYNRQLENSQRKGPAVDIPNLQPQNSETSTETSNWIALADTYLKRGAYVELISFMEPIIKSQPQNHFAWYVLGLAKGHNRECDDAIVCLLESVKLNSSFDDAMGMLGNLYYDRRKFEEAERWYKQAATFNSKWKIDIADAQNKQGKLSEALAIASMVWETQKGNERVKEIYARCLRDHAYQSLSVDKLNGIYEITNEAQLNYLKGKISQFEALLPSDRQSVQQIVDSTKNLIATAEQTDIQAKPLIILGAVIFVLFVLGLGALNIFAIPYAGYRYWKMSQPHYKKSQSTVDRRTGLQS